MRWLVGVVALLVALPVTLAQEMDEGSEVVLRMEDPSGDAVNGAGAPAPGFVDVVAAEVRADQETATFGIEVAGVEEGALASAGTPAGHWFSFVVHGTTFEIAYTITTNVLATGPSYRWDLYRGAGDQKQLILEGRSQDFTTPWLTAAMPLRTLVAEDGTTPGPGTPIQVLSISSRWDPARLASPETAASYTDHVETLPDAPLVVPGAVSEGLTIATNDPVRFSNGEATTYHWIIRVASEEDGRAAVATTHDGNLDLRVPDGIHVRGGQATFSLYATAPFSHDHGGSESIDVHIQLDALQGTLRLAVHYLDIPQPAGHHDTLFLKPPLGGNFAGNPIMNTIPWSADQGDETIYGAQARCPGSEDYDAWGWGFRLDPSLRIGLDARADDTGTVEMSIDPGRARLDGTLWLGLRLVDDKRDDASAVSIAHEDAATVLDVNGMEDEWWISVEVPIPPSLDRIGPDAYSNIGFDLVYCPDAGTPADAFLEIATSPLDLGMAARPGGILQLPLEEYHEPLPFDPSATAVSLVADATIRRAPAGGSVAWNIEVNGTGQLVDLALFGVHGGLAELRSDATVTAGQAIVPVVLDIPEDARDGDILEVILEATNRGDQSEVVAVRLTAVVDSTASGEEAGTPITRESQPAPSTGIIVVGATLLGAALGRRRRDPA